MIRVHNTPDTPAPAVHLLSNGRYHVAVTNAGGGYRRMAGHGPRPAGGKTPRATTVFSCICATRRTAASGRAPISPSAGRPTLYEAVFSQARADFRVRCNRTIASHVQIAVSPEDDVEVRRIWLTNHSPQEALLELTSYAEIVLAPAAADDAHPAFSNLFVETEIVPARCILCTRRPRASGQDAPVGSCHVLAAEGDVIGDIEYETDRARFIGRGRSLAGRPALGSRRTAIRVRRRGP